MAAACIAICAALGLEEMAAQGRVPMLLGGSPMAEITRLSYPQLGDRLVAAGALTAEELALVIAGLQEPVLFRYRYSDNGGLGTSANDVNTARRQRATRSAAVHLSPGLQCCH